MIRNTELSYGSVAKCLHWLTVLLILVAMPISGYLGNGNGVSFGLFAIPGFAKTAIGAWTLNLLGLTFEQWEVPFDFFHKNIVGPFVLWEIITAHAGAAIYHHYVEKDDVLKRMLPEKRDRPIL